MFFSCNTEITWQWRVFCLNKCNGCLNIILQLSKWMNLEDIQGIQTSVWYVDSIASFSSFLSSLQILKLLEFSLYPPYLSFNAPRVDYLPWCVVIVKIHFKIWPCCVVSICSTSNECEYNLSTLDQILVTTDWSWFDKQIMCLYMFSQPQMHGMRAGKDGSVI